MIATIFDPQPTAEAPAQQAVDGQFAPATRTAQPHSPINPKTGKRYSNAGLLQAYVLRELVYDMILALKDDVARDGEPVVTRDDAVAFQCLVKAWDIVLNRLRILRGKGLPAVEKRPRTGHRRSCYQPEPIDN